MPERNLRLRGFGHAGVVLPGMGKGGFQLPGALGHAAFELHLQHLFSVGEQLGIAFAI